MNTMPTIIPVASGKGGVGKSWFTANLALALARLGKRTLAIDLDLGGSNLHSLLGVPNKYPGVGDFVKNKGLELSQLAVPTPFTNLQLIPGDGQSLFMGNIGHAEKTRLTRAILKLEAQYVLLDLGAGSAFNNLDFFALAPKGFLITTPEMPAALNLMTFVKNLVFRVVENAVRTNHPLHQMVKGRYTQFMGDAPITVPDLLREIDAHYPTSSQGVRDALAGIRPHMVLNMGTSPEDLAFLQKIDRALGARLSVGFDHFGFVPWGMGVLECSRANKVYLSSKPNELPALSMTHIADRVDRLWQRPIDRSWDRLFANTQRILAQQAAR